MARSIDSSTDKLVQDFNTVIADTEQLLKSIAATGGEKANAMRAGVEENLERARQRLRELEEAALEKTRALARASDEYVRDHPWESVGIAAGLAAVAGIIVGVLLARR
jgi:ElaB/YqjD/DUF883 family membrane-anchored ribosome-binding protein